MVSVGKTNINNVKDNQNSMILIGQKRNRTFTGKLLLFPLLCSVYFCSHFAENIPKPFCSTQSKASVLEFLFFKVSGLQTATLLEKRLQQKCFLVNFSEHVFHRTSLGDCFNTIQCFYPWLSQRYFYFQINQKKIKIGVNISEASLGLHKVYKKHKQPLEVLCKKRCSKKCRKFHRKTPVLEPKRTPTQVFSCEIC